MRIFENYMEMNKIALKKGQLQEKEKSAHVYLTPTLVKRLYDLIEISGIIKSKGFTNIKVYGDWEGTCVNEKSSKIIIIAEKQS